ncbi:MAG TPA: glycosyltransferase, partial [Acidobacteriota bacterium]|nr:glycosyltransferase [Acidobacteriota bacterium]
TDEAVPVLKEFNSLRFFVAGKTEHSGQKIHNLRHLIGQLPENVEAFAFADSDGRLTSDWLSSLIQELLLHPEDAVTGYRWFLSSGALFSNLRAVWNSGVLTLFSESGKGNFAWGGATAILRKTFFEADVLSHWQGSLSDDLSLTRAMYGAKRKIHFAPKAIAFTEGEITGREFFSWIARQFLITKLYRPGLWIAAFTYHWIWTLWLIVGFAVMPIPCVVTFLFLQIFQGIKAELRMSCMNRLLGKSSGSKLAAWLLSPAVGLMNTVVLTSNLFSRTVSWRGIGYRVDGPNKLTILWR